MFGYFKLDKNAPKNLVLHYKKNYCYLCRSIGVYYGSWSRFLLSYDVTFMLLFVTNDKFLCKLEKVTCVKKGKTLSLLLHDELSQKIAALNILLFAAKIEDDIADENSLKAKLAKFVFKNKIKKAKSKNKSMWVIIENSFKDLRSLEKQRATLKELEACFSNMMKEIATQCFGLKEDFKLKLLELASKWLYFIDAIDDLDENIKKGSYNPFKEYGNFSKLKNEHYVYLANHFQSLYLSIENERETDINIKLIKRILFYSVPFIMRSVMLKQG